MKKIFSIVLALTLTAGAFAQSVAQPAFRLLDGYVERKNQDALYGAKVAPWVLGGTGVLAGAAAAAVWYQNESFSRALGTTPLNSDQKLWTTVGLGTGAVVLTGLGVMIGVFPPTYDEKERFAEIYRETDAALQEKLASTRIQSMAKEAKDKRVFNGWFNLTLASVSFTFHVLNNQNGGKVWSDGLLSPTGWEAGSLLAGAAGLILESPEEILYQRYLALSAPPKKD